MKCSPSFVTFADKIFKEEGIAWKRTELLIRDTPPTVSEAFFTNLCFSGLSA